MQGTVLTDIDKQAVMAIVQACIDGQHLKVMPAEFYRQFRQTELSAFCMMVGLYCLPTHELLDVLNELVIEVSPHRHVIEIGSGNGAIGRGLGIRATDNFMQADAGIQSIYAAVRQPPVVYGANVEKIDANAAVEKMRPEVVIGAWVTHKYDAARHDLGGNMFGIDEGAILQRVARYIVVGNHAVHGKKPIMERVSRVISGDYLFSRSMQNADRNAIFVWDQPRLAG